MEELWSVYALEECVEQTVQQLQEHAFRLTGSLLAVKDVKVVVHARG